MTDRLGLGLVVISQKNGDILFQVPLSALYLDALPAGLRVHFSRYIRPSASALYVFARRELPWPKSWCPSRREYWIDIYNIRW